METQSLNVIDSLTTSAQLLDLSGGGRRHSDGAWVQWTGAFFEHDTWQLTPSYTMHHLNPFNIYSSQPMEECGVSTQMVNSTQTVNLNHDSFVYRDAVSSLELF